MFALLGLILGVGLTSWGHSPPLTFDRFEITLPDQPEGAAPLRGRLIVFLVEDRGHFARAEPLDGPFLRKPQPIVSIAVEARGDDGTIVLGDGVVDSVSFPARLDELMGTFRVRAVLDPGAERSHNVPGNAISAVETIEFIRGETQTFSLTLNDTLPEESLPHAGNLRWIEVKSDLLSRAAGKDVFHRAGVVLPSEYDEPLADRRFWPTIYVIPGFGDDHRSAASFATVVADPAAAGLVPQAVWIFLDPNAPLGHHGFVDSENNGPRGTALVDEFIPWLEQRFRLESRINARIITGHSSGGFGSLWLQLQHPDVFGACFSNAPDPVSFDAFGTANLYRDRSVFESNDGEPHPSMRRWLTPDLPHVDLFIEDELAMERAIAPDGTSGEQWAAWNAMFSPRNRITGLPTSAWDPETGVLDVFIIEADWVPHDITLLVSSDWPRFGPIIEDRVRLVCGTHDSFYLEEAVERLKAVVDERSSGTTRGYIELIDGADHSSIVPHMQHRWFTEMQAFFDSHRHADH